MVGHNDVGKCRGVTQLLLQYELLYQYAAVAQRFEFVSSIICNGCNVINLIRDANAAFSRLICAAGIATGMSFVHIH